MVVGVVMTGLMVSVLGNFGKGLKERGKSIFSSSITTSFYAFILHDQPI
jgi:hypothetical protein